MNDERDCHVAKVCASMSCREARQERIAQELMQALIHDGAPTAQAHGFCHDLAPFRQTCWHNSCVNSSSRVRGNTLDGSNNDI
jgi:hypothetical protein